MRATVDARALFQKLVETRLATGEPYIVFSDTVNRMMPAHHRELGLKVSTSNLCSEITLPTGRDHLGNDRTAVCCLSSLNLETWDEWHGDERFIEDVMRFLDNVLQDYIDRAPDEMARAKYTASRERSVGMGVMGFHSFLQMKGIGFESAMAKAWNLKMFKHIAAQADEAQPDAGAGTRRLPGRRRHGRDAALLVQDGDRADRLDLDHLRRHQRLHRADPGEHLYPQDAVGQLRGQEPLSRKAAAGEEQGFDQRVEFDPRARRLGPAPRFPQPARKRTSTRPASRSTSAGCSNSPPTARPFIDQAQSLNLYIPADVDKWDLMMLHFQAWEKGIKSLYYLRSKSVQRAGFAGGVEADNTAEAPVIELAAQTDYEECLACQ